MNDENDDRFKKDSGYPGKVQKVLIFSDRDHECIFKALRNGGVDPEIFQLVSKNEDQSRPIDTARAKMFFWGWDDAQRAGAELLRSGDPLSERDRARLAELIDPDTKGQKDLGNSTYEAIYVSILLLEKKSEKTRTEIEEIVQKAFGYKSVKSIRTAYLRTLQDWSLNSLQGAKVDSITEIE